MRLILIITSFSGALAVFLGAMGAHFFSKTLESVGKIAQYETANKYHWYHLIATFIAIGFYNYLNNAQPFFTSAILFTVGILLFCGSLYVYGLTGIKFLVHITPIGGLAFIGGWFFMCYGFISSSSLT